MALWLGKSAIWTIGGLSGMALVAAIGWWKLNQLEQKFYKGKEIPPRNLSIKS